MFTCLERDEIRVWVGDPDCQAAHELILDLLQKKKAAPFLPSGTSVTNSIKGNIGEFVALCVLKLTTAHDGMQVVAANANNPLNAISHTEIDIAWIRIGNDPAEDQLLVQEVKTTGDPELGYADSLTKDYDKLFGTDPGLTLQTRVQAIKNQLENLGTDSGRLQRLGNLVGNSARTCIGVHLLPTLVHERANADPVSKLIAVRSNIAGLGWDIGKIFPHAIGFNNLNDRIQRLAEGRR